MSDAGRLTLDAAVQALGARREGKGYRARCPVHGGDGYNLALDPANNAEGFVAFCHSHQCDGRAILGAIRERAGVPTRDVAASGSGSRRVVARYEYQDAAGAVVGLALRYEPKGFSQAHPDGTPGAPAALKATPYHLAAVRAAIDAGRPVFVVEGEKDVETLAGDPWRIAATCNVAGAGKWTAAHAAHLAGAKHVVILPDNDDAGRAHARAVARTLLALASPPTVRIVELPGLGAKGDVTDWACDPAGHTRAELFALVKAAPKLTPADVADSGAESTPAAGNPPVGVGVTGPDALSPDALTDDALALAFAERHAGALRFVGDGNRWMRWASDGTGGVWIEDRTARGLDAARTLCREAAAGPVTPTQRKELRSAGKVGAVEKLARCDARLVVTSDQFDAEPLLLNTPAGVVDLATGETRPARAADLHTRQTAVALGADPQGARRWLAFLDEVTAGDAELVAFLQRVAGYCLTGDVREHALFFAYGTGGNGKGVFLNTLTGILGGDGAAGGRGGYAQVAPIEAFTEAKSERHPTELAMLRGARLVTAQETEEGRRWAESRIKALTGGDPIAARFMRGDFFTFRPQFKLVIAGNHRPHLRAVDEAIRRRLHLIPFEVTIPAAQRDPQLGERLRAEWPSILAWAVDGCAQWLEQGLRPPARVQAATAEYFEAEDSFGQWLAEACVRKASAWTSAADLFRSWDAWAQRAGEHAGTLKKFGMTLQARGFDPQRVHGGARGYADLALRWPADDARSRAA